MKLSLLALLCFWISSYRAHAALISISGSTHRLGTAGKPEWDIFEGKTPESDKLRLQFQSHRNEREYTLFIRQDDVKQEWTVTLNGTKLGLLFLMEADLVHTLAIPAHTLRDGMNDLEIATKTSEDILIHQIDIGDDSKEKLLSTGPVTISIHNSATGEPIPSRITIVGENGSLAPIFDYGDTNLATRPGVIYSATGRARLKLLPGKYNAYATRGPEYRLASVTGWDPQTSQALNLALTREADTKGWVACDTHIHSLSLSKHGDALLRERVITLAGEGIELAASTEHNLHANYAPATRELGLDRYFTILPGNEVTTRKGHFNIFPVELSATPPDATIESWPELLKLIRATPNVQVVILNHPTDKHSDFIPFASTNLHPVTGKNLRGNFDFTFDAMELINSGAMRTDWMEPFRAWFALLNRGYEIVGVGSSDSHDVSRFIVGQGRTYIQVDDSDVGHINLQKACQSLKQGHAVVSLGLYAQMTVSNALSSSAAGPGELLSIPDREFELKMSVQAPLARDKAPRLKLYGNGSLIDEFSPAPNQRLGARTVVTKRIPKPAQDTYYVLIARIEGDTAPAWGLARPYQPASPQFTLGLMGATNPIWVDADGDGKFSSPRDYARKLVSQTATTADRIISELSRYDLATGTQAAELLDERGEDLRSANFSLLLNKAAPQTRQAFANYLNSLVKR